MAGSGSFDSMWTFHPKHKMANLGFLFHRTPFDREYPHPFNDFFWRVNNLIVFTKVMLAFPFSLERKLILKKSLDLIKKFTEYSYCYI